MSRLASGRPASLLALAWVALGANGCELDRQVRERQAIEHLAWLEGRLRDAPNSGKAAFLADLSRAPCPAPDACQMRDRCVSAYTLHVDALMLTAAARQQLQDDQGERAGRLLGAAESKLKAAATGVGQCTQLAAALRRAHKID